MSKAATVLTGYALEVLLAPATNLVSRGGRVVFASGIGGTAKGAGEL